MARYIKLLRRQYRHSPFKGCPNYLVVKVYRGSLICFFVLEGMCITQPSVSSILGISAWEYVSLPFVGHFLI